MKGRIGLGLAALGLAPLAVGGGLPSRAAAPPAGYHAAGELAGRLRDLAGDHKGLVRLASLGESHERRELWAVEVTDPAGGKAEQKPGVAIVAGLQGDEAGASEVALRVLEKLLSARQDPGVAELLRTRSFYFLPRANPDGIERLLAKQPALQRGLLSPYDEDGDGTADEDPPRDVDGDGLALQMRVADPEGDWRTDPAEPRLMVRRQPGERGEWRLLPAEGRDTDGDGLVAEDGPGGVWLDRNFPALWQWRTGQRGAGPFGVSEAETRAVLEYFLPRKHIALVEVLRGPGAAPFLPASRASAVAPFPPGAGGSGARNAPLQAADRTVLEALGKQWQSATGRTLPAGPSDAGDPGSGTFADWAYLHFGALVVSPEVWQAPKPPMGGAAGEKAWLEWSDRELAGAAFTPWKQFQHPQIGAVEIGGWKPLTRDNPPPERLDALAEAEWKFLREAAKAVPVVRIRDARAAARGSGVYTVTLTVTNAGGAPTATAQGAAGRSTRVVLAALDLPPGAKLLSGIAKVRVGQLAPEEQRTVEWTVLAPGGGKIGLTVDAQRGGTEKREVMVP